MKPLFWTLMAIFTVMNVHHVLSGNSREPSISVQSVEPTVEPPVVRTQDGEEGPTLKIQTIDSLEVGFRSGDTDLARVNVAAESGNRF